MTARRALVPAALALLVFAAVAALLFPRAGTGQDVAAPLRSLPLLGTADFGMTLIGATEDGAWGYRSLPLASGIPSVDGQRLAYGESAEPRDAQLVFLRWTPDSNWRVLQTPVDEHGRPWGRAVEDNPLSPRITKRGGAVLVVRDPKRSALDQAVLVARDPVATGSDAGRFHVLPPPARGTGPDDPLHGGEALAGGGGTGTVALTAFDETDERVGAFVAPVGSDAVDGILHWDGTEWIREEITIPDFQAGDGFAVVALSATSAANAWMLARTDDRLGRGIVLLKRQVSGGVATWEDAGHLGEPKWADAATPAESIDEVAPLDGTAESITATPDGVWVDASVMSGSKTSEATLYFDVATAKITGSWCDVPDGACDSPLGFRFSRREGYRSFAWDGDGFGTRVVTNPLDPSGAPETNRGTYLRFAGERFVRTAGAGGNFQRGGAFAGLDDGWLTGPVRVAREAAPPTRLRAWPVSLRAPLTSVAPEPGKPLGSLDAGALAVGADGAVARYVPGRGWNREFLLSSSGAVSRPVLRGVAWAEPSRAHAVGDLGAMWLWRSDTALWEKDPAAPIAFEGNLMDVAFDPSNPDRGYAVGKEGVALHYDKTWTADPLPSGFEHADLTQVTFAGSHAIAAAGGDLLVNDGSGWQVDASARELLNTVRATSPQLYAVAGLPDGGAVAAGQGIVIIRDRRDSPWRFADQPLPASTVVAAGAFREGDAVRALVSIAPRVNYPSEEPLPPPDPNVPPPIIPPFALPSDGYLLRETAGGWRDEQRTSFLGTGTDRPIKSDPVLDIDVDSSGEGWVVGGWSGEADSAGRGSSGRNATGRADRSRVQTGGIYRYGADPAGPPAESPATISMEGQPIRFAVAGHAQCEGACAELAAQSIAPDRNLERSLAQIRDLSTQPSGPRFLAYTGGRLPVPSAGSGATASFAEEARYAELLGAGGLPVFPAVSAGDTAGGSSSAFSGAFAGFSAPFGQGPAPAGVGPSAGASPSGARTHYAFDSDGSGGVVHVIVIDNSAGSLAASDPHQVPAEPQRPWLAQQLASAKARGVPSVVIGSRDLNSRFRPTLNVATDADEIAQLLVDGGASAYFFERPEENRAYAIPSGGAVTIPSFGTGTLGYRSAFSGVTQSNLPDSLFGDQGFLLAEVDASRRDASTNRAPVTVRLIPTIDALSLQAIDGSLLRRSRVALFEGLGRRPAAGDRWGELNTVDNNASPSGGSPYTRFPPDLCLVAGCDTRINPEYEFASSEPDIGDFVKQDPNSTNPRKLLLGENDKPVADNRSSLFCAYNGGTTQVTVKAGGLSYTTPVTILPGSVQRPCGTTALSPENLPARPNPAVTPPPPAPAPTPASNPPIDLVLPPPPPVVVPVEPVEVPQPKEPPRTVTPPPLAPPPAFPASAPPPPQPSAGLRTPGSTPPQTPGGARPIPPGGAVARVFQVEKQQEEELATEESNAFAAYRAEEHDGGMEPYLIGLVLLAALAGAAVRLPPSDQRRRRVQAAPAELSQPHQDRYGRKRR